MNKRNPKAYLNYMLITSLALMMSFSSCKTSAEKEQHILWYKQAAKDWNEALPLGNGRIGAMVFGTTATERIQLNDDSMWPKPTNWTHPRGTTKELKRIRELLIKGDNLLADSLFVEFFSNKSIGCSHQTLGDLYLEFNHDNISDYKRELNISNASSLVSYKTNGHQFTEKMFISQPHQIMLIELKTEDPNGLNGKIKLNRPLDKGESTVVIKSNQQKQLLMAGEVMQLDSWFDSKPNPITQGVKFETCTEVKNTDGEIIVGEDYLELKNVHEATIYIATNSSYYYEDFAQQNQLEINAAKSVSNKTLFAEHVKDYQSYFNRVDFSLGASDKNNLPTDQRMADIKKDTIDLALETTLFQYGRYLLISSSRPGTIPANLQGLWNEHIMAPWNGDFHMNINLQMNYWLADVCNLSELNEPLFTYTDKLIENGKETAMKNFGCRGSFLPHASDLWAPTFLRAPTAYWGCSMGAGGWMAQHYWNHYEYTNDPHFLKTKAYPAIEAIAQFYSDWIIEDPRDGYLVSAPSTSPENRFVNAKGDWAASCLGSAMDQQVINEVFTNYLKAAKALNINNDLTHTISKQIEQLRPGFIIDENTGRILEWDRAYVETEPGHRHMSQLYGFHPGNAVTYSKTPELFEAVKNTLQFRLDNGGAGTGWSRAWLINCSARLLDGEMAHEHIQYLLQKSTGINLFDMHPPFQIDGNFGYSAGVVEMLMQSHEEGIIRLLPALPQVWKNGNISGIKAKGNIEVDLIWENNQLSKAVLKPSFDKTLQLIYNNKSYHVELKANEQWVFVP